jgi:hypothetical protein
MKRKWEVGKWYPRCGDVTLPPCSVTTKNRSGLEERDDYGDGQLSCDVIAFKINSYPKKMVKKTIQRWAVVHINTNEVFNIYTTSDAAMKAVHPVFVKDYRVALLTGEYEVEEEETTNPHGSY